jgi:hypothetical protein
MFEVCKPLQKEGWFADLRIEPERKFNAKLL